MRIWDEKIEKGGHKETDIVVYKEEAGTNYTYPNGFAVERREPLRNTVQKVD